MGLARRSGIISGETTSVSFVRARFDHPPTRIRRLSESTSVQSILRPIPLHFRLEPARSKFKMTNAIFSSSPLIIMGMHRSGTTMLVSMLRQLGLHAGDQRDENEEGIFFLELNEWMMRRAGGAWDNPEIFKIVSKNDDFSDLIANHLRLHVLSRRFAKFMDLRRINLSDITWGWKDPRMIFTLKVWLKVFPNARILYIRRNGVDVAHSLSVRAAKDIMSNRFSMFEPYGFLSRIKKARRKYETFSMQSIRCLDLRNAFDLWCEYVGEAEVVFSEFRGKKMLVSYEDILKNPTYFLSRISEFAGYLLDPKEFEGVCADIDSTKAYGYMSSPSLLEFYETVRSHPLMRKLGY